MNKCENNCHDVDVVNHFLDAENMDSDGIKMVIISESLPKNIDDYFDGKKTPSFIENTNFLFNHNGCKFQTCSDYLQNGIYLTTEPPRDCRRLFYVSPAATGRLCRSV
jgi:hypothetical protein